MLIKLKKYLALKVVKIMNNDDTNHRRYAKLFGSWEIYLVNLILSGALHYSTLHLPLQQKPTKND